MSKVDTVALIFVLGILISQGNADPSISTSTPTPCYGDVVTLVCHHPELASNPGRYFTTGLSTGPVWKENGEIIEILSRTINTTETVADLTRTFLNITITVDHFRDEPLHYSCELVLASEQGGPSSEVETSEVITVDPVEPQPTSGINIIDISYDSIAFNWTHIPIKCYKDRTSYLVYWVGINNYTEIGFNDTGERMYNITGLLPDNTYTISVWAVVNGSVQSTAVTRNVTTAIELSPAPLIGKIFEYSTLIIVVVLLVVFFCVGVFIAVVVVCWRRKRKFSRVYYNDNENNNWVESTLRALCKAFKTPLAVDTHPPVHPVQYADISVDKDRPVRNPSLEKMNYSEISDIGEKAAQLVEDKPPPVPQKKETNSMEEQFQTDVIEVLTEIGMTLHLTELDFFTATYHSMEFLGVSRVESSEDVTPADVEKVVRAKNKMAASRAVFICNQNTIPSDRLIDLQKASCYFIKAGGYGTEKWKDCLISNFEETVGDWMEEQNRRPHLSVEEGILEEDKGVLHPKEEDGVGHPEEEEGVGHPEEKEGNNIMELQHSVEEEGPDLQPQVVEFGKEDSGKQVEKCWRNSRFSQKVPPRSQATRDNEASRKRSKSESVEYSQYLLPQYIPEDLPDEAPKDRSNTSEKESLSGRVSDPVFPFSYSTHHCSNTV